MSELEKRPRRLLELLLAFVAGLLFALGLAISGMTQPGKVVGFLDFAGDWDPSLAFVMVGAIAVYFAADRLVPGRSAPLVGVFHLPTRRDIEPRLLLGAGLFGIGWGMAGYCPGPALSSLATGRLSVLLFVASMGAGMLGFEALRRLRLRRLSVDESRAQQLQELQEQEG